MDSAVALYWSLARGQCSAWWLDYGQRHKDREREAARKIGALAGVKVEERRVTIPWAPIQGDVIPGRNLILLSVIGAQVAVRGGGDSVELVVGANAADLDGFPDCRPEFLAAAAKAIGSGLGCDVRIAAPFVVSTKAEILREAKQFGAWDAVGASWTCYQGGSVPCGECSACVKRAAAFAEVGEEDPWRPA